MYVFFSFVVELKYQILHGMRIGPLTFHPLPVVFLTAEFGPFPLAFQDVFATRVRDQKIVFRVVVEVLAPVADGPSIASVLLLRFQFVVRGRLQGIPAGKWKKKNCAVRSQGSAVSNGSVASSSSAIMNLTTCT